MLEKPTTPVEDVKLELGVEDAGVHIALKRLVKEDKVKNEGQESSLCKAVVEETTDETVSLKWKILLFRDNNVKSLLQLLKWIPINRACFLLVNLLENAPEKEQQTLIGQLKTHVKEIKKQKALGGAKILLQKIQ